MLFFIDQCILSCGLTSLMITFGMMVGGLIPPSPPSHLARSTYPPFSFMNYAYAPESVLDH